MANIIGLLKQRTVINENINVIRCLTSLNSITGNLAKIVKTINVLEDKLKIYLNTEEEILQENLQNCNDLEVANAIRECLNNISYLKVEYSSFRKKFNSREKICRNIDSFKNESDAIIRLIGSRLSTKKIIYLLYPKKTVSA